MTSPISLRLKILGAWNDFEVQIKVGIIAASALVIFYQDIYFIGSAALVSSYFNYVLLIPFLIGFLIYRKRKVLAAVMPLRDNRGAWATNFGFGVTGLIISLVIYLSSIYSSYSLDYQLISLQIFLLSEIILFFNRKTLWLLTFPILLISTALQSAVQFGVGFWQQMSLASTDASYQLLKILGINVSLTTISTAPAIQVTTLSGVVIPFVVGVASSGIYSVVGFVLFAFFVAYIAKGSLVRRIVLFALGFPLLLLVNIFRLVIIIAAAYFWGIGVSDIFHLTSGIVLVSIITLILLVLGDRYFKLDFLPKIPKVSPCPMCDEEFSLGRSFCKSCGSYLQNAKRTMSGFTLRRSVLVVVAVALAILFFSVSLTPVVATAYSPSQLNLNSITPTNSLTLLPQITGWNLTFTTRDTGTEAVLGEYAALIFQYAATNSTNQPNPLETSAAVQISPTLHTPEASVVIYPSILGNAPNKIYEDQDVQILSNPTLTGRMFIYQLAGQSAIDVNLYWNLRSLFYVGDSPQFLNVQISILNTMNNLVASGAVKNLTDFQDATSFFLGFARAIATFWSPVTTTSILQTAVQRWSYALVIVGCLPAAFVLAIGAEEKRSTKRLSRQQIVSLSTSHGQGLLSAMEESSREGKGTLQDIVERYNQQAESKISVDEAYSSLNYLEVLHLAKRVIKDDEGRPVEVWKSEAQQSKSQGSLPTLSKLFKRR